MTYAQLAARVRAHLGQQHRYAHTVRVARCAELLAQWHGLDCARARLAGMLHDLARLYAPQRLIAECQDRQMPIDEFERAHAVVLHARLGARIAQETFGVHDLQVLSAIEKHTLGDAQMSRLDCAVFLADGLEPARTFAERDELWRIARRDLEAGMRAVLQSTIVHLRAQGMTIAPQTLAAAASFGVKEVPVSAS